MKRHLLSIVVALLTFELLGCSKQSQQKVDKVETPSKTYNLGMVEVSDGVQITHDLGDGKVCVITPALQKDGSMMLNMSLEESGKILDEV